MRLLRVLLSTTFAALALACASFPAPTERMANTRGALRAAEEIGAEKVPPAALHLQLAREGIEKAQKLMEGKENERADWTLRRAEADAELALALTKEEPVRGKAQEATQQLQELKQQNAQP